MSLTLTHWPLGPSSGVQEETPGARPGNCMTRVVMLADWHDVQRRRGAHRAQDIFAPRGTPVLAPIGGRIAFAGYTPNGGYNVKIAAAQGTVQMSHFDAQPLVQRGDMVTSGQALGKVGNTGAPHACPHLHIGARDLRGNAINLYSQLSALSDFAPQIRRPRELTRPPVSRGGAGALFGLLAIVAIAAKANDA